MQQIRITSTDPRLAHLQEQQRRREEARAGKETDAGKEQYKPHKTMKVVFMDIMDKHGGIPIFQRLEIRHRLKRLTGAMCIQ